MLFNPEIWEDTRQDLIAVFLNCDKAVEKDAKKATLDYIKECASCATGMHEHPAIAPVDI